MASEERRLHPLSFLFAIQDTAKHFVLPLVLALFAARTRDAWEAWAAIGLVPVALGALARALSVRYRFDDTELVIRSGFIFRRVRHIPYDRLQNVDAVQKVLHRLFGVVEVRLETGGGTEAEAVLRVVDRQALEEIRARVFAGRGAGQSAVEGAASEAPSTVLLAMAPREVLLFGLIHGRGMIIAGALFGLLWDFGIADRFTGDYFGDGRPGRGVARRVVQAVFEGAPLPLRQIALTVAVVIVLLALFRIVSAVLSLVTYYGFTVRRVGDDLRCEYGLLTRVASTIPVRRIQKLTVREGPWHRAAGRVSVDVQTAGGKAEEGQGSTKSWLAPLVPRSALPALLEGIEPEAAADVEWQPVHPRGVRREFVGSMALVVPATVMLAYSMGWWAFAVAAVLTAWAFVHARRTVAALRWATSAATVQFKHGWIWRNRLVAPLAKVQVVSRHQTPFDRRHGMATVFADTAGRSEGGAALRIPYLPSPVAASLARDLAIAAARTSFRW